jgi:hypothetical protein
VKIIGANQGLLDAMWASARRQQRRQQSATFERSRTIMNNSEKSVVTSSLADVRQAPLGRLSAPETLDRLRPGAAKVVVAAFNSSL